MAFSTATVMALTAFRIVNWLVSLVWNVMAALIEAVLSILISWVAIILTILTLVGTFLWIVSL